jgi:hypothetical protein
MANKGTIVYRPGHELEDINSDYKGGGTFITVTKRAQKSKGRNKALHAAMVELRRSNAAVPQRNKSKYRRPKAGSRERSW